METTIRANQETGYISPNPTVPITTTPKYRAVAAPDKSPKFMLNESGIYRDIAMYKNANIQSNKKYKMHTPMITFLTELVAVNTKKLLSLAQK
jgi:hypothetical protein